MSKTNCDRRINIHDSELGNEELRNQIATKVDDILMSNDML